MASSSFPRDGRHAWIPLDTTVDADAAQFEAYRRLGAAGRMAAAFRLSATSRHLATAGIRRRHPEYSDDDVHLALARLLFGDALVRAAWPQCPLIEP
jgi:hypothetical protein